MKTKIFIAILAICCVLSIGIFAIPKHTAKAEQIDQLKEVAIVQNNKESYSYVDMDSLEEDELTGVKYIPNNLYFRKNPKHAEHVYEYNKQGTCTTVAIMRALHTEKYRASADIRKSRIYIRRMKAGIPLPE